jgi:thioredoxin 1
MMMTMFLLALLLVVVTVNAFVPSFVPSPQTKTKLLASLTYLEDDNYASVLKGNNNNININKKAAVLVDVCATWCGPCRLIEPFVEHCAAKYANDLDVFKFDVASENAKQVKLELLLQGVMPKALPSLILFNLHEGKAIATHTGVLKQEQLEAFLEKNLAKIKETTTSMQTAVRSLNKPVDVSSTTSKSKRKAGLIGFGTMERDDYALNMS